MLESLFSKVAGLKVEKQTPALVFSCQIWEIFQNTYLEEHLRTTVSKHRKSFLRGWLYDPVLPGWNSVPVCLDPGSIVNSSKILSCDYMEKVSSRQGGIPLCRDEIFPCNRFSPPKRDEKINTSVWKYQPENIHRSTFQLSEDIFYYVFTTHMTSICEKKS